MKPMFAGTKKFLLFACFFVFQPLLLWALDAAAAIYPSPPGYEAEYEDEEDEERGRFSMRNRSFELSIMQTDVHFANTFVTAADFFQETFVVNLDNLFGGFGLNFGANVAPLSINFNVRDRWGFGLDIAHVQATGNLLLPESVLGLYYGITDELFGAGAAVFVDFGIPVFFHTRRGFRVNLRPAAYVPVFHVRPGITYSFGPSNVGGNEGQRLEFAYDMRVFSPVSMEPFLGDDNGDFELPAPADIARFLGYDISLGVEYPLNRRVTLGVDIVNIPFFAARLEHYTRVRGHAFVDTSFIPDFGDLFGDDFDFPDGASDFYTEDLAFGTASNGRRIRRPFKMLFFAHYRPLETQLITVIPSLGFSINDLYPRIAALEGGLSGRLDLANMFITTIGINYNDRRWRNSIDFAFNFRLIELGIGVSSQSPNFVQSFRGAGVGVNFGLKMGW